MQNGTFVQRVSIVVVFANLALIWQLIELLRLHKLHINLPIFVIVTIAAEIVLATSRLIMLFYFDTQSNIHLYQEQFLTTLVRWIWFTFTMLSYVAVIGYSLKKITIENIKTTRDNQKITELLKEKEALIASLLKANITSTTGALAASIAHELNQPLCASNLNIQFLQSKMGKNELSSELGAKVLASLQSDNQRAADILRSLRAIFLEAKIDAKTSDINELVESILVIIRPELKENNITLNLNLCDFKNISMNRVEIQQVILNLLNNAIQALASLEMTNKVITLSSVIHSDALRLSVADNGKGVAENLQNNLFELLGSSKQVGMGLGLWLCKHIVTRHGGRIWYENTQSGGANFIMELPTKIYD
jgi:signal transduction histidine kinase